MSYSASKETGTHRFRAMVNFDEQNSVCRLLISDIERAKQLRDLLIASIDAHERGDAKLVEVYIPGHLHFEDFDQTKAEEMATRLEKLANRFTGIASTLEVMIAKGDE